MIFNILGLVYHLCIKLTFLIQRNVPFYHIVGGNPDISLLVSLYHLFSLLCISRNNCCFKLWCKPFYLPLPVIDQGSRADNQMRTFRLSLPFPIQQIGNGLQRFPKPHIVCQNSSKTQICQRVQPPKSELLILSEYVSQCLRSLVIAVLHVLHISNHCFIVRATLCLKLSLLLAEHLIYIAGSESGNLQPAFVKIFS